MKINFNKLKYNVVLLVLFSISLIGFIYFSKSFAIYVASGESEVNVDLAFSLLQTDELEKEIKLDTIEPDSTTKTYSFSVANYLDNKLIDLNLDYVVKIISTTNLPISYTLTDWDGNEVEQTNEYIIDDDGTIYYVISTNDYHMNYKDKKIDRFKISYSLGSEYDSNVYQDIIELLTVRIETKQV